MLEPGWLAMAIATAMDGWTFPHRHCEAISAFFFLCSQVVKVGMDALGR